jgi:PadR family transcriptional regulator, regulatory protein PadR
MEQMRRRQYLGSFELMVLLAILRVGEDAYGMLVAREIETASGKEVGLGSVYAALERLTEKGLVSSSVGDPTPERGGRAKQYFRVTAKGLKAAREARHTFANLWHGIPALKGSTP